MLVDAPSFPGCLMTVRPIGMLEMVDQESEDEKILAVGTHNPAFHNVNDYSSSIPICCWRLSTSSACTRSLKPRQQRLLDGKALRKHARQSLNAGRDLQNRLPACLRTRNARRKQTGSPFYLLVKERFL